MFTITWPPRAMSPWMICSRAPVSSCASCSPSAGSEFAVGAGGVVQHFGEDPDHMFIVVEHLVVVAAGPAVPLHEDGVGPVDHDLPHIVVR